MLGCAYTGNYVFSLCIDEVLSVKNIFAGSSVTGECYTGSRGISHIAEYHSLHVYGSTPFFGNLVHTTVENGAFQTGLRFAAENGYDCAMQMDADGQHKPEYIAPMLAALEEGNDIVIGSRFLTVKKPKTLRMLGSYIISWSIRLTTGRAICDPTSGMRMFNRAMVEEFAQNLNYGPEPDTISYLIKNGATVKEVQVEMGERLAGQSYLTFWRSVQYMVKMSISILLIQWFRKRDTETPYPERSL